MAEDNVHDVQKVKENQNTSIGESSVKSSTGQSLEAPSFMGVAQFKLKGDNVQASEQAPSYSGQGSSMPKPVMEKMNSAFNTDFSGVNIHNNSAQASGLGAKAYTQGTDIHFAPGQYNPESTTGQELLGHELTHVVQQSSGRVKPNAQAAGVAINDSAGLESEADKMGAEAAKSGPIQRKADPSKPISPPNNGGVVQGWGIPDWMKDLGSAVTSGVSTMATGAWDGVKSVAGGVVSGATDVFNGVVGGVGSAISGISDGVSSVASGMWDGMKNIGGGVVDGASNLFNGAVDGIQSFGAGLVGGVSQAWDGIKNGVSLLSSDPLAAVVTMGGGMWEGLKTVAQGSANGLGDLLGGVKSGLGAVGSGLLGGLQSMGSGLIDGISSASSGIWDGLKQVAGGIGSGALKLINGLKDGIGSAVGGLKDGALQIIGGLVNTGKSLFDSIMEVGSKVLQFIRGPKGEIVEGEEIPESHILMEYMAHSVAYDPGILKDKVARKPLEVAGYDLANYHIRVGRNGFQAVLIMPDEAHVGLINPILAFRGTYSLQGALTDLDLKQVGDVEYNNNLDRIQELIDYVDGSKVDVTGHSLGGAMAQIFTARHAGLVGSLVTFQSPGISSQEANAGMAAIGELSEEDRPTIAHHIVENDAVDKAGDQNLDGTVFSHDVAGVHGPLSAHGSIVFNSPEFNEAREKMGFTPEVMERLGHEVREENSEITAFEGYPNVIKRLVIEALRRGVSVKTWSIRKIVQFFDIEKGGEGFSDFDSGHD